MKKNFLKSMLTIVVVALLSAGFVSCGDDDEKKEDVSASILGSWKYTFTDDGDKVVSVTTFVADGTGYAVATINGVHQETETFTWEYNTKAKTLTLDFDDDDDYEVYTVETLTNTKLVIKDKDGDKVTLTR